MRAELGQLRVTQLNVSVELERLADENQGHHAIKVVGATQVIGVSLTRCIIMEATRGGGGDTINEAVDEGAGFVFLGQAKRETTDGLRDIEGLDVVVMVTGDFDLSVGSMASLAGIIAGLLGQGLPTALAAVVGVAVHANAGDRAAADGERGLAAGDLLAELRACVNP